MAKKTSKTFSYEEEVVGNEVRITIAAMRSKKDRKQFIAQRVHEMVEEEILVGKLSDLAKALRFKYHGKCNYETTRRYMHPKK